MKQDHEKARALHDFLSQLPQIKIQKYEDYSTNMIWFKFTSRDFNLEPKAAEFKAFMKSRGIIINLPFDSIEPNNFFRFVFHQLITSQDLEKIQSAILEFIQENQL